MVARIFTANTSVWSTDYRQLGAVRLDQEALRASRRHATQPSREENSDEASAALD